MTSIIGYKNLLTDSGVTITASTEATDREKENAYDWNTSDWWQGTAAGTHTLILDYGSSVACDYMACAAHDIFDNSGTIRLFYSDTGTSGPWTGLFSSITPADNTSIFKTFTSVSKRYYKIEIVDSGSASLIGMLSIGARTELPQGMTPGFMPPPYAYNDVINNTKSNTGAFTGRSLKLLGLKFAINMSPVITPAWMRSTWDVFIQHARTKPFFFTWDNDNYDDEAVLARTVGAISPPVYETHTLMRVSLNCEAIA